MVLGLLQKLDKFGHPIGVTYRGETELKTSLGGFVTLLTYVLVTLYTVEKVTELFDKSN